MGLCQIAKSLIDGRSVSRSLPRNSNLKSGALGRSFYNAKSQLGGFPFELSDLSFSVLGLVEFRSLVHVFQVDQY